jgi:hypothetical protein
LKDKNEEQGGEDSGRNNGNRKKREFLTLAFKEISRIDPQASRDQKEKESGEKDVSRGLREYPDGEETGWGWREDGKGLDFFQIA